MRVVYVTHNGIGSPLVRSQVLPYLQLLSMRGHEIDLVTFERGEPYPRGEFSRERWHPLRPLPGRSMLAKLADIARGAWVVAALARRRRAQALHARSYLPAAICWFVGRVLRIPYVFDMRGFMPEEYVDAGIWPPNDARYRAVRFAERRLLRDASEIVVLTHAGASRLQTDANYAGVTSPDRVSVIPCTVDLDRFRPAERRDAAPTLVYSGTLGMWYELDKMIRVYARARESEPGLRFLFLNRNEHELIRGACSARNLPAHLIEIRAVDFQDMPMQLGRAHVAIALLKLVPSKIGSSPTKIAEYLACGLPVVVNAGLGDSDEQIRSSGAGHVVPSLDEEHLGHAGAAIVTLLSDLSARSRARTLAETVFDLRAGAAAYDVVYSHLSGPSRDMDSSSNPCF